jgi:protein involved in sex pheromone biosynthesis
MKKATLIFTIASVFLISGCHLSYSEKAKEMERQLEISKQKHPVSVGIVPTIWNVEDEFTRKARC